jgi:tetratricopeptide (TPR) repeat protein
MPAKHSWTLRLTQTSESQNRYCMDVELEGSGVARTRAEATFDFELSSQEQEDIRWYLEDYLINPSDPTPKIAARVERAMQEKGTRLFECVFKANDDTFKIWHKVADKLDAVRFEVVSDVAGAAKLPWELLYDPHGRVYLALKAQTFVRAYSSPTREPLVPRAAGSLRILLVICRPGQREDVPFRSVASRIIKGLSDEARQSFQLDVLRPPTFGRLGEVLRQAQKEGKPYHIVHFDGHGAFLDIEDLFKNWKDESDDELMELLPELLDLHQRDRFSPQLIYPQTPQAGKRGYLAFENPQSDYNLRLVGGPELGQLLQETDVPALVLNACRSAYTEPLTAPAAAVVDVHDQVRTFGTFAQQVMDAGVTGVVAMRYNVYVVTAAQFVADLYAALAQGQVVGEAVTLGRKKLADQPQREIAYAPIPLQDWSVPVVYEATPLALAKPSKAKKLTFTLRAADAAPGRGALDPDLPKAPDVGFYGRDETLLALDRAFDTQRVVLLHAYAGSGKTAAAAEFARWYALTGGIQGPVLFTSFEQYRPLPRALDVIGRVFESVLEQNHIHWLALGDKARKDLTLQILKQIPALWIWDNVEQVAGFPAETTSAWSAAEQKELADFLRDAKGTKAKFLLTSRRDERGWLGDLPARVTLPPMPMQERVQLARALAEKHGRRLGNVDDWRPLLQFTDGNPLTLTVVVGQALREGRKTKDEIEAFVAQLRAGEAVFEDEATEGRSKSLRASLSYGFDTAFTEAERKQLALLHFFQGFVNVNDLLLLDHPQNPARLPELRGLTREASIALLDRAAEIGLLTAHGAGYYAIHPALPWYFRSMFEHYYSTADGGPQTADSGGPSSAVRGLQAFVEAMGELAKHYWWEYESGNRDVIASLTAEEANLLHARQLARVNGWWRHVISTMQGLRSLYDHTGRRAEWKQLVDEIVPDLVDPQTGDPLPGREDQWGIVTEYCVRLAQEARQWAEAERLQRVRVDWERQRAAAALAMPPDKPDDTARNAIRTLAVSVGQLGDILREQGKPDCVEAYQEDYDLSLRIGDQPGASVTAFNLGHAYLTIPALRDLDEAELWYRRSLELLNEHDRLGRGKCLGQLGLVARERFKEARAANQPTDQLNHYLQTAADFYHQALDLLPSNAVNDLAALHNQLGIIYAEANDFDSALPHWREAIRYDELQGDLYGAARTRFNVAVGLAREDYFADALEYAQAALRNYSTFGDRAAAETQMTQELIEEIKQAMKGRSG